jgi:hypothetical protein
MWKLSVKVENIRVVVFLFSVNFNPLQAIPTRLLTKKECALVREISKKTLGRLVIFDGKKKKNGGGGGGGERR